jgi:hypothetical protein
VQELGGGAFKLLYDSSDLLAAIATPPDPAAGGAGAGATGAHGERQSGGWLDGQASSTQERRRQRRAGGRRRGGAGDGSSSGSDDDGGGLDTSGGGIDASTRRWLAAGAGPNGSLLWCVRAPSREWLQSFFADLRADKRQVRECLRIRVNLKWQYTCNRTMLPQIPRRMTPHAHTHMRSQSRMRVHVRMRHMAHCTPTHACCEIAWQQADDTVLIRRLAP